MITFILLVAIAIAAYALAPGAKSVINKIVEFVKSLFATGS